MQHVFAGIKATLELRGFSRGPPETVRQCNQSHLSNVSSVTSNTKKQLNASLEQLTEIKQNLEQYH
eukprot:802620-Ditylum_brightwellii.AAC.1